MEMGSGRSLLVLRVGGRGRGKDSVGNSFRGAWEVVPGNV